MRAAAETALKAGDYRALSRLSDLADALQRLGTDSAAVAARSSGAEGGAPRKVGQDSVPDRRRRGSRGRRREPGFHREGSTLVKTGRSSGARGNYQHRASWAVVESLVRSLTACRDPDRLQRIDEILPLHESNGERVPDYQTYAVLAWLRDEGLVQQHGRRGYTISAAGDMLGEAERAFQALPAA